MCTGTIVTISHLGSNTAMIEQMSQFVIVGFQSVRNGIIVIGSLCKISLLRRISIKNITRVVIIFHRDIQHTAITT